MMDNVDGIFFFTDDDAIIMQKCPFFVFFSILCEFGQNGYFETARCTTLVLAAFIKLA